jgi:hypothetical protein
MYLGLFIYVVKGIAGLIVLVPGFGIQICQAYGSRVTLQDYDAG